MNFFCLFSQKQNVFSMEFIEVLLILFFQFTRTFMKKFRIILEEKLKERHSIELILYGTEQTN